MLSLRNELAKWLTNPLVASRALVVFLVATVTVFGNSTGSLPPIGDVNLPVLYGLARWDSGYYLGIATDGYAIFQHGYSFRPLFPLAIRALYPAFPWLDVRSAEVLAGFLWNLVAVGIAAFYLERLTKQLLGPAIASSTLLLLAVYPSTFFFTVIYSEATCILFIASSLYYLEKGRILLAGGLGLLPYTINFATMILAVIFVAIPLIRGNVSSKLFPYYTWAFVLLAVVFYSGEVRSFARFALVVPPVFWAQAEYSALHPRFFRGLIVVYSVLMCLATILWVNWYPML